MDKFWPMFDKEGWSCWICEYMYNEENTRGFMTANLVSGFIQRSDSLRKYAFGNMNILKDPNEPFYRVMGGWLIRGKDIKPMLDENPDAAYYTWRKVDETNEEDKKLLADLWCASDSIFFFCFIDILEDRAAHTRFGGAAHSIMGRHADPIFIDFVCYTDNGLLHSAHVQS